MTRCKSENLCAFRLIKGAALLKFWKFFSSKAMFCVPTCASGSLSQLYCHKLMINLPYNTRALGSPALSLILRLLVAVMWAFLQSDQTIRDVLPAYGPLHHQHVLIWSFALQRLTRRGGCLLACVTALEQACWSNCLTKGCGTKKIRREKVCLVVCNVWNICTVCQCSRGRTVSEDRWRVRVTVCPYGPCQLN